MSSCFELRAGELRLAVRPDLGGAIAGLWHHGVPVLRSTEPEALVSSRRSACYPLVPYSNRVGFRTFQWGGRAYTTEQNFDDNPHSVHGVAWLRPWTVVSSGANELVLRLSHVPDAHWPFAFDVLQRFVLTPERLSVSLDLTNTAPLPQPVGLGWHPYFPERSRSHIQAGLARRWLSDDAGLPTHAEAQPGIDDFVGALAFDHCFDGWQGVAELRDEAFALRLSSSLDRLVVYTPRDKGYFCVEPVSHLSNAIQQPDPLAQGLRELAPGARFAASMDLAVVAL